MIPCQFSIFGIILIIYNFHSITGEINSVPCESKDCFEAAKEIIDSIDETVNPCDDFYQFSCGHFFKLVQQSPNPKFSFSTQAYQKTAYDIIQKIEKIITSKEKPSDSNSLKKAKIFYQRCMQYGKNDVINFFLDLFSIVGGWPVLMGNEWNEANFNWLEVYKVFKDRHLENPYPAEVTENNGVIKIKVLPDLKNYVDNTDSERYEKMIDAIINFGGNKEIAQKDMYDVLAFESELSKIKFAQKSNPESQLVILKTEAWFPWSDFLLIATGHPVPDVPGSVSIDHSMFFPELKSVLKNTPKRVQANYMLYKVLERNLQKVDPFLERFIIPFENSFIPDTMFCKGSTESIFQYAILAQYFKEYNSNIVEQRGLTEIIENIKNQFLKQIAKIPEYSSSIVHKVQELYEKTNIEAGFPKILTNSKLIENVYSELMIGPSSNFFEMMLEALKVDKSPLGKLDTSYFFSDHAHYSPEDHEIVLSTIKTNLPHYSSKYPACLNYGRFGDTFAHELAHAIFYDILEGLKRNDENVLCIKRHYGSFKVDADSTNIEDMADNAGFQASYHAYLDFLRQSNTKDFSLPGLRYTPQQLFWISRAITYCQIEDDWIVDDPEFQDEHSSFRVRINAGFSLSDDFTNDFKCAKGTNMNSAIKCNKL